jgi:CheY-like chemotaxis protein
MKSAERILIVDDSEDDVLLFQQAFRRAALDYEIVAVRDGEEAMEYLGGRPPYEDRAKHPLPHLLVLDLKMPRANGFQVLAWLQDQPDLRGLPVVVLTGSDRQTDMEEARKLGAQEYQVKPIGISELVNLARHLSSRWLKHAPQGES